MSEYKKCMDEVILARRARPIGRGFRKQIKSSMTNEQLQEFIEHAMKVTEDDFVQRGQIHGK